MVGSEAYLTVAGKQSKALADQLATVSKERFGPYLDHLSPGDMDMLEHVIKLQLGLL